VDNYAPIVGKGLRAAVAALVAASVLALAGTAAAATPGQIYQDAADNGKLDKSYSAGDLSRYKHDATVSGYGNKVIKIIVQPKITPKQTQKAPVRQAVAPQQTPPPAQVFKPPTQPQPQVFKPPSRSALPFTGSELALFVALGIALLAGGFLLRMMTGRRSAHR
jgi:hypothetical protein